MFVDDKYISSQTTLSRVWLQTARVRGGGPPFMKVGRRCVYKWSDVVAWLEARMVRS